MSKPHQNTEILRANMVDSQVRPNQVNDARVIAAMRALRREDFAPACAAVYADADVDLGGGRYLPAPMLIGRLAQLVLAGRPARVLVVGAGAGYGAAILASAGVDVVALESEARLLTGAAVPAAMTRVTGSLAAGFAAAGPYDAILIEGAVLQIPEAFSGQLAAGGRVVAILAERVRNASTLAAGLGRAVVAQSRGQGFAVVPAFDCTARLLPAFLPAPEFVF